MKLFMYTYYVQMNDKFLTELTEIIWKLFYLKILVNFNKNKSYLNNKNFVFMYKFRYHSALHRREIIRHYAAGKKINESSENKNNSITIAQQ